MTPKLRRNHRLIWLALAILLPAGLIAALRLPRTSIPHQAHATPNVHQRLLPTAKP